MDTINKRSLDASSMSTLAALAAMEGPTQRVRYYCEETDAPYEFVPGDVTAVDGWTSVAPTGGTAGRWLLRSDRISIASIDGGVSDDWVRLNSAMAACAGKCAIHMRDGAWRCNTAGVVPSNIEIIGGPGVRIVSTLAPTGTPTNCVFRAVLPASANVGTIDVTPAAAATTIDCALPLAPVLPFVLWLTNAGGQTQQVFDATSVAALGAGKYRIGLSSPIVFPFVATNSAQVIPSYPKNILIRGNGMVVTGTGDRVVEFAGAAQCLVEDITYDTSAGAMSECAFSYDNGGRENVFENLYADMTGAGANVACILLESQVRSVARHCRGAWPTGQAFEIINSFGTSIETSHAYNDTLGGFSADDGGGLGLGCFDCGFDRCTSINSGTVGFSIGKSVGARLTGCATVAGALCLAINSTSSETIVSDFDVRDSSSGAIAVIDSDCKFYGFTATRVTAPAGGIHKLINITGAGDVKFYGLDVTTLVTSAGDMQVLNMEGGGSNTTVHGARITIANTNGYGFWNQVGVLTLEDVVVSGAGAGVVGVRVQAGATLRKYGRVDFSGATAKFLMIAGSYINSPTGSGVAPEGTLVLTGLVAVNYAFPDIKASDSVKLTRRVQGVGVSGITPTFVITAGVGVAVTGSVATDVDTYDIEIG